MYAMTGVPSAVRATDGFTPRSTSSMRQSNERGYEDVDTVVGAGAAVAAVAGGCAVVGVAAGLVAVGTGVVLRAAVGSGSLPPQATTTRLTSPMPTGARGAMRGRFIVLSWRC